ncbi:MAG TPA: hypothetical protein VIK91_13305 [Nannocystis sp.]
MHHDAIAEVKAEQCPECGPHGNRWRVVLAFSEVACTVCAGGVPSDAFGLVQRDSFNCGDAECRGCDTCFPTVR